MDKEYQGHKLAEEGQRKLQPGCWEALCSSKEERLEQAKQCFERAGNCFKLEKKWFEAGECYEKCANIEESLKNDASTFFEEAAHCFKFVDKKRSINNLNKGTNVYEKNGRFSNAGDTRKKIAEEYESNAEYALAITEYKKASDYYEMERSNNKSSLNTCSLKYADLLLLSNHENAFEESKQIYEKIGMQYLTAPLLKASAKDLFFKCVVVYLAFDDYLAGDAYLSKFLNEDASMYQSREHQLLSEFIEAMKEKNVNRFKAAVTKFKETSDLDKWKIHLFTKIMEKLEKETNINDIDDFK